LKTNKKLFFICAGPVTEGGKREKEYIEIQNLLNKLKSSKYFLDLPPLQHNKLKDIYNVTDIMLFPTYSGGEQHPLVAVEAIASKTILITSKIASLQEVIIDKQNGFLIDEPKKIDEIVNIIEEVSNNFKKYEFIKENARKTAIEKFDWKISAKKFEDILKGLL
jgi:glycosyltransferase involved in cell wall biosynthesis